MRYEITLHASIRVRHHLPQEAVGGGLRDARAVRPHDHVWDVRATWSSDAAGSTDLDLKAAALRDAVAPFDGADLNDVHQRPTTEWFAAYLAGLLRAARVEITDEERRSVTCYA